MRAIGELHQDLLEGLPSDTPITMINLIKFREHSGDGDGSGQDAYARYSAGIVEKVKEVDGVIEWAGKAHGAAFGPAELGNWDFIAKVTYPTKEHFIALITSPEFEAANHHRRNGVERHVIIATEEAYGPWNKD